MDKLFIENDINKQAQSLADYLPNGKVWQAKNIAGSNFRKLLLGLGAELLRTEQKMNEVISEFYFTSTTQLIKEWEKTLGIPDDCISIADTLQGRINNILLKLSMWEVVTAQDFVNIAQVVGLTTTVSGGKRWQTETPTIDFSSDKEARFTIVVDFYIPKTTFPYEFPITFGSPLVKIVIAIFEKLKPANTQLIYRYR